MNGRLLPAIIFMQSGIPLSGSTLSLAILLIALLVSAYVLWQRYQSRRRLMQRVTELETLSAAGRTLVAAEMDTNTL